MALREPEISKWADVILTEAHWKIRCTVHENYKEEEKEKEKYSLPCLIIHSVLKQINLKSSIW